MSPADFARALEWNSTGYALAVTSAAPAAVTPLVTTPSAVLSPKAESWFPPGVDYPSPAPVAATIICDPPGHLRDARWSAPLVRHPLPFLASVVVAGSALRGRSDRRHDLHRETWSHPLPFLASVVEAGSALRRSQV